MTIWTCANLHPMRRNDLKDAEKDYRHWWIDRYKVVSRKKILLTKKKNKHL